MSAITRHSTSPPSGTLRFRPFSGLGQRLLSVVWAWRASLRQRSELLMLNEIEVRELLLTEADVNREANKPFWKSVSLINR